MSELLPAEKHVATGCKWKKDEDGNWDTGCGNRFFISNDEGPIANGFQFCCYCGLSLDELPYDDGDEDFTDEDFEDTRK